MFDDWLTLRGVKSRGVRMDRLCESAQRVADMLAAHPRVAEVFYPGLASHPGREVAAKQMRGFGGRVSFRHRGGGAEAAAVFGPTPPVTRREGPGGGAAAVRPPCPRTHAAARREAPGGVRGRLLGLLERGDGPALITHDQHEQNDRDDEEGQGYR